MITFKGIGSINF